MRQFRHVLVGAKKGLIMPLCSEQQRAQAMTSLTSYQSEGKRLSERTSGSTDLT